MLQQADRVKSLDDKVESFQVIKRAYWRFGPFPKSRKSPKPAKQHHSKDTSKDASGSPNPAAAQPQPAPAQEAVATEEPSAMKENISPRNSEEKAVHEGPARLAELTERTQDVLYEATTVFPFTLFPDTVRLDREKLTIASRFFWRTANITSVPVSEVLSAVVNVGPFFGSLHLVFSFFADNERTINFLPRKDCVELQRLLHGYIIAHKRKINTTSIGTDELCALLREIGQGAPD